MGKPAQNSYLIRVGFDLEEWDNLDHGIRADILKRLRGTKGDFNVSCDIVDDPFIAYRQDNTLIATEDRGMIYFSFPVVYNVPAGRDFDDIYFKYHERFNEVFGAYFIKEVCWDVSMFSAQNFYRKIYINGENAL